jgi:hypothetical protein
LSGGLGSSTYVHDQLQQHFAARQHPNARQVEVIRCNEPQLVVARGLLLDRQERWQRGGVASVLAARVARASYGVIVKRPYSPAHHANEDIVDDDYDPEQRWAINQIEWLIEKGQEINPNGSLTQELKMRLAAGELKREWDTRIVISHNEAKALPKSMKQGACARTPTRPSPTRIPLLLGLPVAVADYPSIFLQAAQPSSVTSAAISPA